MNWLNDALTVVWSVVESAFSFMTSSAYFAALLAIGLIIPVFRIIKKAKKTAAR